MPRTASSIIARAGQKAKIGNIINGVFQGYASQLLDELNDILDHIALTLDFSAARGQWFFTFNTELQYLGNGNIIQAAPNPLPLDYLRVPVSGGSTGAQKSSIWYLDGVPYPMVEIDLPEWDNQVQQAGIQSYPYFWAKDIAQYQVVNNNFQGDLNPSSQIVQNVTSTTGLLEGMSIYGGIGPNSAIVPGTTIEAVGANTLTLSEAPTSLLAQASLVAGYPAVGLPYPPPSGAFAAMVRYQRMMPPLTQAQVNNGAYCWFPDDAVLLDLLTARGMDFSGMPEQAQYEKAGQDKLGKYIKQADDTSNRAQTVQLDRRVFGKSFSTLRNTKSVGWTILACVIIPILHALI